jgi:hypothetical protein
MQRSLDAGETWPEDQVWLMGWEDFSVINPEIDFVDGTRAFGVHELVEQDPYLYFHDYEDIDNPDTWNVYYFDRSNAASYVKETAVAANKSGRIALASVQDYDGSSGFFEDTILITWDADNFDDDTADGGVYWLNRDNEENPIPYSNLCADAGDKIFFVFQRNPFNDKTEISTAYCRIDEATLYSDWRQTTVASNYQYNCSYPDVSVSGKKVYVTYMVDKNDNKDIYVSTSTSGGFWSRYPVTDSIDDEIYPVISANDDKATILFMKNNNIYSTTSEDFGKTWSEPEQVNDIPDSVVEEFQFADIKSNYGFWTDQRNEDNDIYFDIVGSSAILVIDSITSGFGITATVSNVGNAPAEDISWSIDLDGLVFIGNHFGDTIAQIAPGETISIQTGFSLGLGQVTFTITVGETSQSVSGFMLGPFVLGLTET